MEYGPKGPVGHMEQHREHRREVPFPQEVTGGPPAKTGISSFVPHP